MRNTLIVLVFVFTLALGSCAPSQSSVGENFAPQELQAPSKQESQMNTPVNPIQSITTPETSNMTSNPPSVDKFVALSKKDLAERLKLDTGEISLLQTAEIVWPNAALGCPAPGKVYPQGRVPGFKIWLENGGVQYIYHTDYTGQILFCPVPMEDPMEPSNPAPGSTEGPNIGVPIQ